MRKRLYIVLILLVISGSLFGQNGIGLENLKSQRYLKIYYKDPFDCENRDDHTSNTLCDRICANLVLQKSDSILTIYCDSLLIELRRIGGDSLVSVFKRNQKSWREFRDQNGEVIYSKFNFEGGSNLQFEYLMSEIRILTDLRTEELKKLILYYRKEKE